MFLITSVTLAHRLVGREKLPLRGALLAMEVGLGSISGSFSGPRDDITTTSTCSVSDIHYGADDGDLRSDPSVEKTAYIRHCCGVGSNLDRTSTRL